MHFWGVFKSKECEKKHSINNIKITDPRFEVHITVLNTKCLLCILEIPHSNFAWRPAIITKHPCGGFLNLSKVYAPLQTVRRRSIYSMHFWSFPSYIQECLQQKICTLFMKFTSFHHTKFPYTDRWYY